MRDAPGGCTVPVRVYPGAKRNAVTGVHDGAVKVSLTAPPADGRANEALIAFVAERLRVTRAQVTLLAGAASRSKTLRVVGLTAPQVSERLTQDLA